MAEVDGPPGADAAGGVDSQGQEVLQERCLTRSRSGSAAAASAPAQLPGAAAAAAAAGEQKGGQAARPSSAPVGGKGSGAAGQQAAQPAAAEAGAAAAGSPRQLVLGGGIRPGSGWQQDAGGRWSRVLTATSCRGGSVSLSFPRDLFQELAGRPPGDKDQLEVLGAGAHQYSFQYAYRESSRTSTLAGADLRRWVTDTGARRGDSIALQRSGNAVHVQHIPAGGRAKGTSGSLSPSPASAAAQAGGAVRPHGNRKSTEQSEQQGGAAAAAAAGGGRKDSRRPSHEQQEQLDGQASAAAAADGGRKGGKRPSGAEEAGGSAAATAGAASPAEAAGGDDHLSPGGGSSSVPKGWHQDADGWWRRTLTATACRRARLGMQRTMFKALTGRQPEDEDELEVLAGDSHTYSIQYVFEASSHSTNLTGKQLAQWVADTDAQEGDEIALRCSDAGKVEICLFAAGSAAGSPIGADAAAAAGGGGSTGAKQAGRAAKREQPAAAGQAAQRAKRAAGAGAASSAPVGVESDLTGAALVNRRIVVRWSENKWYTGRVVDFDSMKRSKPYSVEYDDGEFWPEDLLPGEWRLLEDAEPAAAEQAQQAQQAQQPEQPQQVQQAGGEAAETVPQQAEQAQQVAGGRRRGAAAAGQQAGGKRQRQASADGPSAAASEQEAQAAEEEPAEKKQRRGRKTAQPAAGAEQAQQAKQEPAAAAGCAVPAQAEQPGKAPRRGRLAAKEAARLLEPGQDPAALEQSGRGRRKTAEATKAAVRASLRAEQAGEVAMDAPLPPEVPAAAPALASAAVVAAVPAAAAAAAPAAEAAEAAAATAAAPAAALTRQPSQHRRQASGSAKPRSAAAPTALPPAGAAPQQAGAAAAAAGAAAAGAAGAAGAEPLPPCYWYELRQAPFNENLPRDARRPEMRGKFEHDGLSVTSCHDCQEPCYKYPCQSGGACSKTFCHKCTELYRYLLAFGPEDPEQFDLRRRFVAGHCPCCLRICLRSKCRQKSLESLGGEAPVPHDSESRQIVLAYHLAHRLLPAVEHIMALHQEEARAARTSLEAAQRAEIGYVDGRRAPHSERALCNRCATCLENLHFHCTRCDQDICPICAREARQDREQAAVKCTACHTNMQPMRFLDDQQLALLQQARHRLDAALGGALSGGSCGGSVGSGNAVAAAGAGASPLPRLLWNLCKGSCGCEHDRAEWIEPETDWLQRLRQAAAFSACHAPPPPQQQQAQQAAQQLGQQQPSLVQPPQQQQQGEAAAAALQACATAGGSGAAPSQAGDLAKTQALLALMQAQAPDAATRQRQQQLLQPLLVLQSRAEGRAMPDWAARPEQWTPAMVQHAQHAVQPLAARVQAVAGQPGQVLALQAQPPLLQQPPLQLLQAPQLLPYSTASGAASQEAPWPRLVSRPSVQQPGDGGGWNAGQFIRAAAAEQLQHQAQQQHAQHAVANGMLLQRQAHVNGVRSAEGSADDGSEARPKRQRKVSQKLRDAEEGEEGEVAGQHRQQAQQAQQQAVPAAGGAAAGAAAGGQLPAAAQLPKELSLLEKDARQWWWHAEQLPESDVRLASRRDAQDFIWTPHADQFRPSHPHYQRTIRIFQMLWDRGEPIIVRGLRGSMGWTPEAMGRVCKESNSTKLQVLACSSNWTVMDLTPREFFERYKLCSGETQDPATGEPLPMLKLKDFPPTSDFKQVMARHHDDFLQLLNRCLPAYTHPTGGALNLACHLPWYTRLPDLGPKGYIAFGREVEHEGEGDSVTKMHEDLSDAINIMLHTQHRPGAAPAPPRCGYDEAAAPGYGGAGAVWDLVRREDRPALRRFLTDAVAGKIEGCPPFVHKGRVVTPAEVHDVMHDQCFMLTARHRQLLAQEPYGVHVWHVEQYEHEAVWIPGGCAHQVRNLRSSIKVALDFVSPDAVHECLELRGEFRQGAKKELQLLQADHPGQQEEDVGSRHFADKLQIGNMVLHGFLHSLSVLEAVAAGRFEAVPRFPPPLEQPWSEPDEDEAAAASKPRQQRQRRGGQEEEEEEGGWEDDWEVEGARGPSRGGKRQR